MEVYERDKVRVGSTVRFTRSNKFENFKKGETATIVMILALYPFATDDVYFVGKEDGVFWCTGAEIEPWNQISLF